MKNNICTQQNISLGKTLNNRAKVVQLILFILNGYILSKGV
jgi:hypothetical protein